MEREYRVGADVTCTDGSAGQLKHLIMDPGTKAVTHLVVDTAPHFGFPVLVPRDRVAEATDDGIRLNCSREQLRLMDPFEQAMYVPATDLPGRLPSVLYPGAWGTGTGIAGYAGVPMAPASEPVAVEEDVPPGEYVVDRDSAVEAKDGEVGQVEDILTDPANGRITHLVVRSGHLWAKRSFRIPASAIERVDAGVVRLRLTTDEVRDLSQEPS